MKTLLKLAFTIGRNSLMNKICTIICNYNYKDFVIRAIDSAINQTYKNHDVYFVDDGSTDGSFELVKEKYPAGSATMSHSGAIYEFNNLTYAQTKNSGASAARNFGIQIATKRNKYDAIHILDSDDVMYRDKIEIMEKVLFEYDEIGVVYGDYFIIRPQYSKLEHKEPYSYGRLRENCIVHSGSMIKTKYLNIVAPRGVVYNPELHGPGGEAFMGCTEDYDLWLRLSNVCMFSHIPEVLTIVCEHGKNQSLKMNQSIFNKNMDIIRKGVNV